MIAGDSFEVLWTNHRKDVEQIARSVAKWQGTADVIDRLMAVGQVALWEASSSYDPVKFIGVSFWGYARHRIRGAMLDELRSWDHLSRDGRDKLKAEGDVKLSWTLLYPRCISTALGVADSDDPEKNVLEIEKIRLLHQAVEQLSDPRNKEIARKTLIEQKLLADVGKEMGLTESRISQIRREMLAEIQEYIRLRLKS